MGHEVFRVGRMADKMHNKVMNAKVLMRLVIRPKLPYMAVLTTNELNAIKFTHTVAWKSFC